MGPIRILHLSDLHIEAGCDDAALLQPLAADLRDGDGCAVERLDFLVVSGDSTNTATPKEFTATYKFLAKLIDTFRLPASHVAIVPGNHDLSWDTSVYDYKEAGKVDVTKLQKSSYLPEGSGFLVRNDKRYPKRFQNFSKYLYEPLLGEPYSLDVTQQGVSFLSQDGRVQFLLLNSAWQIDNRHKERSAIYEGALSRALEAADADLSKARSQGCIAPGARPLRIAVWHHPVTGNDKISDDAFLTRLQQAGVRLCLHGHVHEIRADIVGYWHTTRHMHIIGAGSFGAPAKDRPESTPALYNLIELDPLLRHAKVHTRGRAKRGGAFTGLTIWPSAERHTLRSFYSFDLGDYGWAAPPPPPTSSVTPSSAANEPSHTGSAQVEEPRSKKVKEVEAAVVAILAQRPHVAQALAAQLAISAPLGDHARVLAKALVQERTACDVAQAVNHVDYDLTQCEAESADRSAIRHLLWLVLPFAINWQELVEEKLREFTAEVQGGAGFSGELPLDSATIAEIILAGIDNRRCQFGTPQGDEMPIGVTAIRLPAATQVPLFDLNGSFLVESVVQQVAAATGIKQSSSYTRMRDLVETRLLYRARQAPGEILPYYVLFDEDVLGEGEGAQSRWVVARSALPRELPSLRLVRLNGRSAQEDNLVAEHINDLLGRSNDRRPLKP